MKKEIGFVGLGKMGTSMVSRLNKKGWRVFSYDTNGKGTEESVEELMRRLAPPRTVWLMVPAGDPVEEVLDNLFPLVKRGDVVIDGGNSFFKDSVRRAKRFKKKGAVLMDIGISGGPVSIKQGRFAVMVGGEKRTYERIKPLLRALSDTQSGYMGSSGAGHFAKMVHNGIEYGMMQAMAEGFTILKKAPFGFKLRDVARVYNQNSIITSRLTSWLEQGFAEYGEDLKRASGSVDHTGEGEWTVKTAREFKLKVPVIEDSFRFRVRSKLKPSFTGKILSTLRAVFGGHSIQ